MSYLIKPVEREKLFACLDRAKERCGQEEPVLLLDLAGGTARVRLAQICYLESDAHDTQVHCVRSAYSMEEEPPQTKSRTVQETEVTAVTTETVRCRTGIRELEERLARYGGFSGFIALMW